MLPDIHIHTRFSCDSQSSMDEVCRKAINIGLPEIGISEHFDMIPLDRCSSFFQADSWWESLERCRREYQGALILRAGIEIGEPHRYVREAQAILDAYPWDYSLGSLHWVNDDSIYDRRLFDGPQEQIYRRYFEELARMTRDGVFDILAHADSIKYHAVQAYGPFDPTPYEDLLRGALKTLAQRGLALEINASGFRRSVAESSPGRPILDWFYEVGGQWVTFGSDAHSPEEVGADQARALTLLQEAGFKHLARFENRRPSALALDQQASRR